jgi:hypothetical protein
MAVFGSAALAVFMVITNYMACTVSFELLGFDRTPLYRDRLLGPFFLGIAGKATLTDLFSLMVSVIIATGLFLFFHVTFQIFKFYEDRRAYLLEGDTVSAGIITHRMWWHLGILSVVFIALVLALRWDIHLFLFRAVAGAMALEDPGLALKLASWETQMQEKPNLWFIVMARIGVWGYISITAIACLCLEYSIHKLGECWSQLANYLKKLWPDNPPGPDEPGTDPPHDDESASHEPEKQQDFKSRQSNKFSSNMSGNEPIEPFSETSASSHLFDEPTADDLARPSADCAKQAVNTEESAGCTAFNQGTTETTPVVGCKKNEHASRSTALSDERHVVDPADHKTIWDADYYKALFEDPSPS